MELKTAQATITKNSLNLESLKAVREIQPDLVFLFGHPELFESGSLGPLVKEAFPQNVTTMGCSTSGNINADGINHTMVITGVKFDTTKTKTAKVDVNYETEKSAGEILAKELRGPGLKGIFLLAKGMNFLGSDLLAGMESVLGPDVLITGGLASDEKAFKCTYTLLQGEVTDSSVVAIGLYGPDIKVSPGSRGGWQPFGPVRKVTRANLNILSEVDGSHARNFYDSYLPENVRNEPGISMCYPIALVKDHESETGVIRTVTGSNEEGALFLAGDIQEGTLIRLMHANTPKLVDGARTAARWALENDGTKKPGLALLLSCTGRLMVMGDETEEEVEAVKEELGDRFELTGFYAYGEICPFKGFSNSKMQNQTMTITLLTE